MPDTCPTCDTLWRLYSVATGNHQTLVGKHSDARSQGDGKNLEILDHEISIAESAVRAVRRELRRHELSRHNHLPQENQKQKS